MSITMASYSRRTARRVLWRSREAFFTDAGLFFFGAAGALSVNIVGSLPGDELLLFPMLPVLLMARGRRAFSGRYLWFYLLTAAWLFGTIFGDVYNGSPLPSRMKGVARVIFFGFDFMAAAILINNKTKRFVIFALSIVAVMLYIAHYFSGSFLTQWKFGLSSSLTIVALIGSSYFYTKKKFWICLFISLFLAAINLKFAFRSQVCIILISAVFTLPLLEGGKRGLRKRPSRSRNLVNAALLLTIAGSSAYLANQAVKYSAASGLFEEGVADKFQTQSEGRLGVLFGGRPETLVAIQAIKDRPIIGHGSFAVDQKYLELKQDIQYEYGYSDVDTPEDIEDPVIPTHSHLTMAWVESGILGGLLWTYLLIQTTRAIFRIPGLGLTFAPLFSYLLVNFIWDILYSPLGSVNRLWGAYVVLLAYNVLSTESPAQRPPSSRKIFYEGRSVSKSLVAH